MKQDVTQKGPDPRSLSPHDLASPETMGQEVAPPPFSLDAGSNREQTDVESGKEAEFSDFEAGDGFAAAGMGEEPPPFDPLSGDKPAAQLMAHSNTSSPFQFKGSNASGPTAQPNAFQPGFNTGNGNKTGMPDGLISGLEKLSGMDLSDIKVHYNSDKPAQLNAHAYAQGQEIFLGPGKEQHLPHEAWHIVQQKQGRVRPTKEVTKLGAGQSSNGKDSGKEKVNDDPGLEREADVMGEKALRIGNAETTKTEPPRGNKKESPKKGAEGISQRVVKSKGKKGHKVYYSTLDKTQTFATKLEAKNHEAQIKADRKLGTKAGMKNSLKRNRTENRGDTFTGRWTKKLKHRGPRSMKLEKDPQLLRHLSTAFFSFFRNKLDQGSEQEVECMLVNNRIFVSANLNKTLVEFKKHLAGSSARSEETLISILTSSHDSKNIRTNAVTRKLAGVIQGTRSVGGSAVLKILAETFLSSIFSNKDCFVDYSGPEMVTSNTYKNKVIYLTGFGDLHAEQKLILALAGAGHKGPAIIRGKKRPCSSCYLMLKFANEVVGLNIDYNVRPGGYWGNANEGVHKLAKLVGFNAQKLGHWLKGALLDPAFAMTHKSRQIEEGEDRKDSKYDDIELDFVNDQAGDPGFDTASDSDEEVKEVKTKSRAFPGKVLLDSSDHPKSVVYPGFRFSVGNVPDDGDCFYHCCLLHLKRTVNPTTLMALRTELATKEFTGNSQATTIKTPKAYASDVHIAAMAKVLGVTFILHENPYTKSLCRPIRVGSGSKEVHLLFRFDPSNGLGHVQPMTLA